MPSKLVQVQQKLEAPKGQYNSFGKYNYRSCEDILAAVKPLANELDCVVMLSDKIVQIGERYYIEATATFYDMETGTKESVIAYAREEETKKGMDASQITGCASSYARKYALNGLFAIDDTKDADATNTHGKGNKDYVNQFISECMRCGLTETEIAATAEQVLQKKVTDLNEDDCAKILNLVYRKKGLE